MNDAHLHLLINHFPIVGLFFGIGILIFGILKKSPLLINTAYVIFLFCTIMGKASMFTGEKAEEIVENIGVTHEIIHEHEEHAESFMKILYLLGIASIIGLYVNFKRHPKALIMSYLVLVICLVALIMSKSVGTSGGEIMHKEIS
jgi:uncharacterized membrane protein